MQLKHQLSLPSDTWNNLISSLSHVSEARQQRVDAFLKEISNDVQVICDCDNILVLDHGKVLQLGTPAELLREEGLFRQIYDMQMAIGEEAET